MLSRFGNEARKQTRDDKSEGHRRADKSIEGGSRRQSISALKRRNLFRLRLINNSDELLPCWNQNYRAGKNLVLLGKHFRLPVTAL